MVLSEVNYHLCLLSELLGALPGQAVVRPFTFVYHYVVLNAG